MKKILAFAFLLLMLAQATAFAYRKGSHPSQDTFTYGQDAHNRWTRNDNMNNDSDSDGVTNRYDRSDRNPFKF